MGAKKGWRADRRTARPATTLLFLLQTATAACFGDFDLLEAAGPGWRCAILLSAGCWGLQVFPPPQGVTPDPADKGQQQHPVQPLDFPLVPELLQPHGHALVPLGGLGPVGAE